MCGEIEVSDWAFARSEEWHAAMVRVLDRQ